MTVLTFSRDYLDPLIEDAKKSPRQRQHKNIHKGFEDPCQRFLNAISNDSYIRPHRHSLDPKAETLVAVRGLFALVTFENDGRICQVVKFGTEKYDLHANGCVGVELSPGIWHTIIAIEPVSILLELKAGPFDVNAAKELAAWAPNEQTPEAAAYLNSLRNKVGLY